MAWSDAARAAAAEARRRAKKASLGSLQGDTSKVGRKMIVQRLRLIRAGKNKMSGEASRWAHEAAASTRIRNFQRKTDRRIAYK